MVVKVWRERDVTGKNRSFDYKEALQIFIETSAKVNAIVIKTHKIARNSTLVEFLLFETGMVWADYISELFSRLLQSVSGMIN